MLASDIFHKELIYKIYKESFNLTLIIIIIVIQLKSGQRTRIKVSLGRTYGWPTDI